ncbi:MAG: LD-carboxypeptidase [Flavihumibacter sp.]|nr:LD-carboxypeptidase [Flavihumibacter sp.]
MKRKLFLSSLMMAGAAVKTMAAAVNEEEEDLSAGIIPRTLKTGDTIAITSPAGYITLDEIQPAIKQIESWGLKVRVGSSIGKRDFTFGGTDEERAADMQVLLDDHKVKAILCARGGYGAVRIVDRLNFTQFLQHPKWLIGFSDITVLHSHINRNFGVATIHSKMCNSFPDDWQKAEPIQIETILSIRHALMGAKMEYSAMPDAKNKTGLTKGVLVGGNLKTLESLAGSKSDLHTAGKILFVEDTGEYLYSIDRMFWNLKRTGKLALLKGLIIGGFKIKASEDPKEEFGKDLREIVLEKVKNYKYPVCFDFPVGHQKNNFALKCGVVHQFRVSDSVVSLREI